MFRNFVNRSKEKAKSKLVSSAADHSVTTHVESLYSPSFISSCEYSTDVTPKPKKNRILDTNPSKLLNLSKKRYDDIKLDFDAIIEVAKKRFLKDPKGELYSQNIKKLTLKRSKLFQIASLLPRFGILRTDMTKSAASINPKVREVREVREDNGQSAANSSIIFEEINQIEVEEITDDEIISCIGGDIQSYIKQIDDLNTASDTEAIELLNSKIYSKEDSTFNKIEDLSESKVENNFMQFIWPSAKFVLNEMNNFHNLGLRFNLFSKPKFKVSSPCIEDNKTQNTDQKKQKDKTHFNVVPDMALYVSPTEKVCFTIEIKKPYLSQILSTETKKLTDLLVQALYQVLGSEQTDTAIMSDYFSGIILIQFEKIEPSSTNIPMNEPPKFKAVIRAKFIPYIQGRESIVTESLAIYYIVKRFIQMNQKDPYAIQRKLSEMKKILRAKDIGRKLHQKHEESNKYLNKEMVKFKGMQHFTIPLSEVYADKYLDKLVIGGDKQTIEISFERLCSMLKNNGDFEMIKEKLLLNIPDLQTNPAKLLTFTLYDGVIASALKENIDPGKFYERYYEYIAKSINHINKRYVLSSSGKDGIFLKTPVGLSGFVTLKNHDSKTIGEGFFKLGLSDKDNPKEITECQLKDKESELKNYNELFAGDYLVGESILNNKCYLISDI